MTTPDLSAILEELASGRIDAAEAGRRIDALKSTAATEETPREPSNEELAGQTAAPADDAWAESTDRPQHTSFTKESFRREEKVADVGKEHPRRPGQSKINTGGVDRITVRAVGRRVRIVGETSVATLSADGPHVLRRNGSTLEVSSDGEVGSSIDGFSILRAPRSLDDFRSLGLGKELFLRVNPNITVDVEVTAGSLHTERLPHLGKVRVTAGGAKLLDVREANDVLVQAGQATIKGAISTGRNRIRAESGSLNIELADDSNVTVKGDAQLGKVNWSGGHDGLGDEVVMGNGSARLDVEVVMGYAQVRVGSDRVAAADKSA